MVRDCATLAPRAGCARIARDRVHAGRASATARSAIRGERRCPLPPPTAKIIDAVRNAPGTRVKVAVSDIDGVLRGKYLHKDKFFSAAEGGFGFCDVVFGWDMMDVTYDNTTLTGWHKGFPGRARAASTSAPTAPCPGTTACRSSSASSSRQQGRQGSPAADLPAAGAEARAEARREARLRRRCAGWSSSGSTSPRRRRSWADKKGVGPDADHAGDVRLLAAARQREPRVLRGADQRDGARSACRSRACTPRPAPASTRRRSSSPRRSRRPTARSCSRPAPRRSARASASCRASWRSGTRSYPAAPATSTSRCPTARRTSSTTRRAAHGMSKLFESYLAGPGRRR